MKNLFLLESPFQIKNAKSIGKQEKNIFIVRLNGEPVNDEQIYEELKRDNIKDQKIYIFKTKKKIK